ncbi:MAG: cyclodeaminase/cyclohydrolase family protein [Solobacterium sp.]|nr:cyclodeaminase/cyclohydrolase family protein [Solobacterium sp.]
MTDLVNEGIIVFSEASASKDPVPGGGGVSALCGSLAASLAEMVTNLTIGKKKYLEYTEELTQCRDQADMLRQKLLACIEEDAEAFAPLAEAYALPKDSEGYAEKMESCLRKAAQPPFEIMRLCTQIIEMDERLAVIGSKLAVSDAATSVVLARGAMYGGYMNVLVNTRLMKDREYAARMDADADALLKEYSRRADDTFEDIRRRLTDG